MIRATARHLENEVRVAQAARPARTLDWIGGKPRLGTYETLLASLATRHPHLDHGASLPGTLCTKAGYLIELPQKDASGRVPIAM